ncbi:MAG: hypothetical protein HC888_03265 [Candidatus Competibacteraceae bacterium]|nr:hypothetical protein [Candidatus Competibacteraceae bacterium]
MNLQNDIAALIVTFGAERVKQEVDIVYQNLLRQLNGHDELQPSIASVKRVTSKVAKHSEPMKAEKQPAKKSAKRTLSPEARARIVEAQRKRWAKTNGEATKPKRRTAPRSASVPVEHSVTVENNSFDPEMIAVPFANEVAPTFMEN